MNKLSTLLLLGLFCTFATFSQTTIKPAIGFNVTDFSKTEDGKAMGKVGYQVGGSIAFGKKIYFEPGIFYVGKSTDFSTTSTSPDSYHAGLKGIRIPAAVGINLLGNSQSGISLRAFGGPSVFFITSTDDLNKGQLNTTHWGLFAGGGIDFWKLFVDLSYEWSLTNIQKDISTIDIGKTRSFYLDAGFRFNFK